MSRIAQGVSLFIRDVGGNASWEGPDMTRAIRVCQVKFVTRFIDTYCL